MPELTVCLWYDTDAEAAAFREFLQSVVWAVPENAPALAGEPRAVVLRVEDV